MINQDNYIVYMHISPVNKVYIGITCQSLKERWRNGKGYKGCTHFNNAINQYGWDNFTHKVIFENLSKEEAETKERLLIKEYKSTNKKFGYNIENGGNANGKHSEETKQKIGKSNKGKHLSEQTKRILSIKHKGKKLSEEHRKKLTENLNKYRGWNKGLRTPDNVRKKIALANTGKKLNQNSKTKISESKNKKVKCIETGEIFNSAKEANLKMVNRPYGCVYKSCQNLGTSAYGYHWCYIEDNVSEDNIVFKKQPKKFYHNGESHNLSEWCKILKLDYNLISKRVFAYNWDFVRAIKTPKRGKNDKK